MAYKDKFEDPRWRFLRSRLIKEADRTCHDCSQEFFFDKELRIKGLEIHHCWYEYGKEPWDYPDDCFLVLCRKCHGTRQKIQNSALVVLGQLSRLLSVDELKVLTFELVSKKAHLQRKEVFEL